MLISVNTVFRSTLVILIATLLILPLIRTAKNQSYSRRDTHKVEDFLEAVNKTANSSQDCIEVQWVNNLDSITIQENWLSNPIQVLNRLLPGKILTDPISDESMIAWTCSTCKSNSLHNPINDWFDVDTFVTFPFSRNYTSFIGQLELQSADSLPQRLYSFFTSSEPSAQGRFSGGVLGLLLIEKQPEGNWKVKALNSSVMYQGSFGKATGVTKVLQFKEFGNILVLNCPSIEAADIEGCNSYVEDSYLINGNNLDLITRIPGAQKVCKNATSDNMVLDFPIWSADMKISTINKSAIGVELEIDGMYMVSSELSEKWRYMGLLDDLPVFLQKKFPDKFKHLESPSADGPIAKIQFNDSRNLEESSNSSSLDSIVVENKEPAPLKGFCIPYKAKIGAQISISPMDGKMTITPWKIQLESK